MISLAKKIALISIFFLSFGDLSFAEISFTQNEYFSDTGFLTLSWEKRPGTLVRVSKKLKEDKVETLYEGRNQSLFLSGMEDQKFSLLLYEVLPSGVTEKKDEAIVEVIHHSFNLSVVLFVLGLFVVFATVAAVLFGSRK